MCRRGAQARQLAVEGHTFGEELLPAEMAITKKGKGMACQIAVSFAAVAMGISCIATDALEPIREVLESDESDVIH